MKRIVIQNWTLENGKILKEVSLCYHIFGQKLGNAPVVLVNHALTGNSKVAGKNGWWKDLIGENKTIDTYFYTVLAFNIPGNGYDGAFKNLVSNYKDFSAKDIAAIFWEGIKTLEIESLFAVIGGSLGGGIAWEMAALEPNKIENLIPIATDWKATDWVIANVLVQNQILNNSQNPIADARLHAMLLYRTPQSLKLKFNRKESEIAKGFQIENWLSHHGKKLQNRFHLSSYKLMNHLLKTIDITKNRSTLLAVANTITANIHIISVDSDLFFIPSENLETYEKLVTTKENVFYHEIKSIHGHDAFLIEFEQLSAIISPIFIKQTQKIQTILI
ncbi:MAG: alpha/beta fold hydrolase [Flavobacteriaceae bacterium]|nr:alpha/beta fold hydrolase [Flavobacteriaceae bacterium]